MYWQLRFVREKLEGVEGDEPVASLKEVYFEDDGRMMGYADPCLFGSEDDWPATLSLRVAHAAALPVIDGTSVGSNDNGK